MGGGGQGYVALAMCALLFIVSSDACWRWCCLWCKGDKGIVGGPDMAHSPQCQLALPPTAADARWLAPAAGPSTSAMPATPFTPAARLRGPDALPTPETGATLPGARAAADLLALSPGQVQEAMQRGGNSIAEVYTWYTEMVGVGLYLCLIGSSICIGPGPGMCITVPRHTC